MICGTNAFSAEGTSVVELLVNPISDICEFGSSPSGTITAVWSNGETEDVTSKASTSVSTITMDTTEIIYSFRGKSVTQTVSNIKKTMFPGNVPVLKDGNNNGSYTISDSEYFVKVNQASTVENSPILSLSMDLTNYSTMRITSQRLHAWNNTWVGYWLLSEANWKSGSNVGLPSAYLNNGANKSKCAVFYQMSTGGTAYHVTETLDYDISSLNGIYYLDIGTRTSSDNQDKREAIMRIYEILLLRD